MSSTHKKEQADPACSAGNVAPDEKYKVGPGRPPKQYQFKPGQSGNPKGAKRKERSIAPDIRALLHGALIKRITLKRGDRQQVVSMAAAGIEQLVTQYVKGDRHARRDIFWLADKLGVDLTSSSSTINTDQPLPADQQAILDAFVERQYNRVRQPQPVFAPAALRD